MSIFWFVVLCACLGVCGFLTFGANVSQDVLMSYPSNDIAVAIARAFIVVCVVTSYPILHFCGRYVSVTFTLLWAFFFFLLHKSSNNMSIVMIFSNQGRYRGTVAALPGWAGGGVRPPWAQEAHPADAGLVCGHPPSGPLHPRHWSGDITDWRIGSLLYLCFSRLTRHIFFTRYICCQIGSPLLCELFVFSNRFVFDASQVVRNGRQVFKVRHWFVLFKTFSTLLNCPVVCF